MTENEHRLIVLMFMQQNIRFRALLEILKSRGVLESGDFEAFERLASQELGPEADAEMIIQYRKLAEQLGLLDELPPVAPY